MEQQQLQLQQLQKELQQQQQLINNLEQVEVTQDQRIQDLKRQNTRILGKLHECELLASMYWYPQLFVLLKLKQGKVRFLKKVPEIFNGRLELRVVLKI